MLFTVGNDIDFALLVVIFGAVGTLLMLSLPVLRLIVESFFCLLEDLLPELSYTRANCRKSPHRKKSFRRP